MLTTESTRHRGHDGLGPAGARMAPRFLHEHDAREFVERLRWPGGPTCAHCGTGGAYRLTPKAGSKRPVRQGVLKCRACYRQFTVTVGTVFEDSHVPLRKWLLGIQRVCESENGVSARQLARELGISYKTAALMLRRLGDALARLPRALTPTLHAARLTRDGAGTRPSAPGQRRPPSRGRKPSRRAATLDGVPARRRRIRP